MKQDTEITGPLVANLWVSSTSEDMDLFVTLRNIGPDLMAASRAGGRSS